MEIYVRKVEPSQNREARDCSILHSGIASLYRTQELVWLILEQPVSINLREGDFSVRLWPGIVEKVDAPPPSATDPSKHGLYYHVKILSLNRRYSIPQEFLSPFQAHLMDETISQTRGREYPEIDLSNFDPFPRWLVSSDRPPVGGKQPGPAPESLVASLLFDMKAARLVASCWGATRSVTRPLGVSGTIPRDDDHEQKAAHLVSDTPPPRPPTMQHDSYRGLWWGAENVQVGDLLRLSFSEGRFAYTVGASVCFADESQVKGNGSSTTGGSEARSERCMFLELRSLISVNEKKGKALHAVGQLYKLVQVPSSTESKPSVAGGGSELPQPPEGHTFHRILANGWEAQLPLRLVRGRYYPRLRLHLDDATCLDAGLLRAMEGLKTGGSLTPRYNVTESREETIERAKQQSF